MRLLHMFALLAAALTASCSSLQGMLPSHQASRSRATELQELQLKVMRFADEYTGRVYEPIQYFLANAKTPEVRLIAQNWRLSQATSAYTIASGPNPITNALDVVVEDDWVKNSYGNRAAPLSDVHRELEPQAWALLDGVLSEDQLLVPF